MACWSSYIADQSYVTKGFIRSGITGGIDEAYELDTEDVLDYASEEEPMMPDNEDITDDDDEQFDWLQKMYKLHVYYPNK